MAEDREDFVIRITVEAIVEDGVLEIIHLLVKDILDDIFQIPFNGALLNDEKFIEAIVLRIGNGIGNLLRIVFITGHFTVVGEGPAFFLGKDYFLDSGGDKMDVVLTGIIHNDALYPTGNGNRLAHQGFQTQVGTGGVEHHLLLHILFIIPGADGIDTVFAEQFARGSREETGGLNAGVIIVIRGDNLDGLGLGRLRDGSRRHVGSILGIINRLHSSGNAVDSTRLETFGLNIDERGTVIGYDSTGLIQSNDRSVHHLHLRTQRKIIDRGNRGDTVFAGLLDNIANTALLTGVFFIDIDGCDTVCIGFIGQRSDRNVVRMNLGSGSGGEPVGRAGRRERQIILHVGGNGQIDLATFGRNLDSIHHSGEDTFFQGDGLDIGLALIVIGKNEDLSAGNLRGRNHDITAHGVGSNDAGVDARRGGENVNRHLVFCAGAFYLIGEADGRILEDTHFVELASEVNLEREHLLAGDGDLGAVDGYDYIVGIGFGIHIDGGLGVHHQIQLVPAAIHVVGHPVVGDPPVTVLNLEVRRRAGVTLFALEAHYGNVVAILVLGQFAIDDPIPDIADLHDGDLGGHTIDAGSTGITRITLVALSAGLTLVTLVTFITFLALGAVGDGGGGTVREEEGIAGGILFHLGNKELAFQGLHNVLNARNRLLVDGLHGLLEGRNTCVQTVNLVAQGRVIILLGAACCKQCGKYCRACNP